MNEVWTYDFLEARTERGSKLRMLTVLNEYTRECLTIHVAHSISSRQVIKVLEWLFLVRGRPDNLRSDNGPEFSLCRPGMAP
jgi:transposase InsO family protein